MENKSLHEKRFLWKNKVQLLSGIGYLAATILIIYMGIVSYNQYKKDLTGI